jgi:hypothetical protein
MAKGGRKRWGSPRTSSGKPGKIGRKLGTATQLRRRGSVVGCLHAAADSDCDFRCPAPRNTTRQQSAGQFCHRRGSPLLSGVAPEMGRGEIGGCPYLFPHGSGYWAHHQHLAHVQPMPQSQVKCRAWRCRRHPLIRRFHQDSVITPVRRSLASPADLPAGSLPP